MCRQYDLPAVLDKMPNLIDNKMNGPGIETILDFLDEHNGWPLGVPEYG